jgi:hypothetical protein
VNFFFIFLIIYKGQTRDLTSRFVAVRTSRNNKKEQEQEKRLSRLEIVTSHFFKINHFQISKEKEQTTSNTNNSYSLWSLQNALVTAITEGVPASSKCTLCM